MGTRGHWLECCESSGEWRGKDWRGIIGRGGLLEMWGHFNL